VVHLAALWAEQSGDLAQVQAAVRASSPTVLNYLGLDAEVLAAKVPDPELFSDISSLT